jgi:ribosomal protein S18 acetylase RimI-like enzyme
MNLMPIQKINIRLTSDPAVLANCAEVMAKSDPWVTLEMDYDYCVKAFDGPCKEIYVVETEEKLEGFLILQVCGSFKGYIQTLFVKESARGKGLGHQLLAFAEERILRFSPNIFICVSSFNVRARLLYEEFGFEYVGELKDFVRQGFSELLYRKTHGPLINFTSQPKKSPEC